MRKNGKNRLMPLFVTITLILSMVVLVPQTVLAAPAWDLDDFAAHDLVAGESLWVNVTGLTASTRYYIGIDNETDAWGTSVGNARTDDDGVFSKEIHVPARAVGEYNLSLFSAQTLNETNRAIANVTLYVNHSYLLKYKVNGEFVDYLLFNKSYTGADRLYIYIYEWDGSKYVLFESDVSFSLLNPDASEIGTAYTDQSESDGIWAVEYTFDYEDGNNLENSYLVNATYDDDTTYFTNHSLPVKLMMDADVEDVVWGETIQIEGYLKTGDDEGAYPYTLALYGPLDDGYQQIATASTYSSGYFSIGAASDDFSAGTWYLGTYMTGSDTRVNETADHNITGDNTFIMYDSFTVSTLPGATVTIESPEDIVSGFTMAFNVSVKNVWQDEEDWLASGIHRAMKIHVDGLDAWIPVNNVEIDGDDGPYEIPSTEQVDSIWGDVFGTEDDDYEYAYYQFNITFNETGTGSIIVTFDHNDSYYEDATNGILANITGSTTFSVGSPDDITIMIEADSDEVAVDPVTGKTCCWENLTTNQLTIDIYGDNESTRYNATSILITGAGLDMDLDDDEVEDYYVSEGSYVIPFQPKTGGTVTVTVTAEDDDENEYEASKDYAITGLYGSVTTSIGDDKEITVGTTETITATVNNGQYAEVHLCYVPHDGDEVWDWSTSNIVCLNDTTGDGTAGNGQNGVFDFIVLEDDLDYGVGWIVVAAKAGADYYMYDIIEVAPVHDLVIEMVEPVNASTQKLTVGLEPEDFVFEIYDASGVLVEDIDEVTGKIVDEDHDEDNPLQTTELVASGDGWVFDGFIPYYAGDLILTAVNNTGDDEHDGNYTFEIDYATITFSPTGLTCAIGLENQTVNLTCVDANGDPLPDGTTLILNIGNDSSLVGVSDGDDIETDEDGLASFELDEVGDVKTDINITMNVAWDEDNEEANITIGEFNIGFPIFTVDPSTVFIGQANTVSILAEDLEGNPIEGLNLSMVSSIPGILSAQPDPAQTDADGMASLSISPLASGYLNITIARNLAYVGGQLNWTDLVTDSSIAVSAIKRMTLSVSESPIYEGATLTVTVTSNGVALSGATVTFGQQTKTSDASGQATFTVPDPGVESALYNVKGEKSGYEDATASVTVLKVYTITIITPTADPKAGESFSVTVLAKGSALAGATVTFNGKTQISGADGKASFTAPTDTGDYPITAAYESLEDGSATITVASGGGIPGFELVTLVAALGVCLILLRRRK